ncbi:SDR family NAD(P)-dependent oxidoreductase [Azospirillum argentinense]
MSPYDQSSSHVLPDDPSDGNGDGDARRDMLAGLLEELSDAAGRDVAIVGIAGRYPGAPTLERFWERLRRGDNCVTEIPRDRWDWRRDFSADRLGEGGSYSRWGGFLDGVDRFDPLLFGLSPREAEVMDPQERQFLETVWMVLENAGYTRAALSGADSRVGVFAGVMNGHYGALGLEAQFRGAGGAGFSDHHAIANRVSYCFDFRGPSIAVDTACSSSLTAIHLACQSLRAGECDAAIAGGVNLILHPSHYRRLCRLRMLTADDRCKAFSADADGFVDGEGVGAVLLKPLPQAIADGDRIHGVILGTAINAGGKTGGYTVPNPAAQAGLITAALDDAGIDPRSIGYVEAHGTGTALGDPIEIAALTRAWRGFTGDTGFCAIGSVKSNIGHLESAAGIAGLSKVLLQMRHGELVPTLHADTLNPKMDIARSPFVVQRHLASWPLPQPPEGGDAGGDRRRAAVSSFGAGGANAHLVVEEFPGWDGEGAVPGAAALAGTLGIVVLSAATEDALSQHARRLRDHLADPAATDAALDPGLRLASLAWTLQVGREPLEHRVAFVADSLEEAVAALERVAAGESALDAAVAGRGDGERWELARRWAGGAEVDWRALVAPSDRPPLIDLPHYPFARERHWLPADPLEADWTPAVGPSRLRLDARSLDGPELVFRLRLDPAEPWLGDHQVGGRVALPGVATLELAVAAMDAAFGLHPPFRVSNLAWLRLLTLSGPADLFIGLSRAGEEAGVRLRLFTRRGEETVDHAEAWVTAGPAVGPAVGDESAQDPDALRGRAGTPLEGEALYERFERAGIAYGPYYRALRRLWVGEGETLAELEQPDLGGRGDRLGVLDGALQAIAGLLAADPDRSGAPPLLPFAVASVDILGAPPSRAFAHVRRTGADRYTVAVLDEAGRVSLRLQGVALREGHDPLDGLFFQPCWSEHQPRAAGERRKAVLLVAPAGGVGVDAALAEALERWLGGRRVLRVALPVAPDAAEALGGALAGAGEIGEILFVTASDSASGLADGQERGVLSLFRLFKALGRLGYDDRPLGVTVITQGAHAPGWAPPVHPGGASARGLALSVARERPAWTVACLDAVPGDPEAAAAILAIAPDSGDDLILRQGLWYRRWLVPAALPPAPGAKGPFRTGGVYLIVGGAGGLGFALSRHLAAVHGARLAWIGRRPLDGAIRERLDAIAGAGGSAVYLSADVTDPAAMAAAVRETRRRFGAIHGAVHSALVLDDRALDRLDEAALTAVMAAKVAGTAVFCDALRGEPLDFMAFFSSAQSFVCARGQSNYAAGSVFADTHARAFAAAAPFPVTVVNWGYWGETGIVAGEDYRRRLADLGVGSISAAEGMAAVERALALGVAQVAAVRLSARGTSDMGIDSAQRATLRPASLPPGPARSALAVTPVPMSRAAAAACSTAIRAVEELTGWTLLRAMRDAGLFRRPGDAATRASLAERLGVVPRFERLFDALLDALRRAGFVTVAGEGAEAVYAGAPGLDEPGLADRLAGLDARRDAAAIRHPEVAVHLSLLRDCARILPAVLAGRADPMGVLFPDGSIDAVAGIYQGNAVADHMNGVTAAVIAAFVRGHLDAGFAGRLRILEVGAGTGGTSAAVLAALSGLTDRISYCYTDISPAFLNHARARFAGYGEALEFRTFDLEQEPEAQGLDADSFDLIVGTNVVHATRRISATLRRLKRLLRRNGLLVLNEAVERRDFATVTFGQTTGWWLFEDAGCRLPGSPLLPEGAWRSQLDHAGFAEVTVLGAPDAAIAGDAATDPGSRVLAGWSDGVVLAPSSGETGNEAGALAAARPEERRADPAPASAPAPAPVSGGLEDAARDHVRAHLAAVLKIAPGRIRDDQTFDRYGVDSLVVMDVGKRLEQDFGRLPSSLLFETNTVAALAARLLNDHPARFAVLLAPSLSVPAPQPAAAEPPASPPASLAAAAARDEAIAVIGMAGRFPGAATPDALWANLAQGRSSIREVPPERWRWPDHFDPDATEPGKSYTRWGGFLDDADRFDARFFGISPREAARMDPQERLFLETVWSLLEDAGCTSVALDAVERRAGVFVGVMNTHYGLLGAEAFVHRPAAAGGAADALSAHWSVANRVSYTLDLQGPSMAVDTACSSSLTAVHLACESLRRGECAVAVAGGVNLILHPLHYIRMSAMNMLSRGDRCHSFGAAADGFVDGEGVGAVLLKPLSRALADGDRIDAVILGSAVNAGGRTSGFTVPSPNAQARLVADALEHAGVDPATVGYLEAHGTGTVLGDPIEVAALTRAFARGGDRSAPCALGSLKSNIGHLESAAGVAGLIKVVLMMRHGLLVPTLNAEPVNPRIDFAGSPFALQTRLEPWRRPDAGDGAAAPRRAGISSFGAGGANAHLVVEEPPEAAASPALAAGPHLIPLSAPSADRIPAMAAALAARLRETPVPDLADAAFTLQCGRNALDSRLVVLADSLDGLCRKLEEIAAGRPVADLVTGDAGAAEPPRGEDARRLQARIDAALASGDLAVLARAWADGAAVDWRRLPANRGRRPLSLPGQKFAGERHWIRLPRPAEAGLAALHPLVHRNMSGFGGLSFAATLAAGTPLLRDHRIHGTAVLPGAACLEMIRAACALAGRRARHIRSVVWPEPLVLETAGRAVALSLTRTGAGTATLAELASHDAAGRRRVHGRAELPDAAEAPGSTPLAVAAVAAACPTVLTAEDFYDRLGRQGLTCGPSYRTVESVHLGEGELLARLRLAEDAPAADISADVPADLRAGGEGVELHPALLDGALQCVVPLITADAGGLPVPAGIGSLVWSGPLPARALVHVRRRAGSGAGVWSFDLTLADADGRPVAAIDGFELRAAAGAGAADAEAVAAPDSTLFFTPVWRPAAPAPAAGAPPDGLLVLVPSAAAAGRLLPAAVDLSDPAAVAAALAGLREGGTGPRTILILDDAPERLPDHRACRRHIDGVLKPLAALCRDLMQGGGAGPVRLVFAFPTVAEDGLPPLPSAFAAFGKCLAAEDDRFRVRTVAVAGPSPDLLGVALAEAAVAGGGSDLVLRRDGGRWLRGWSEGEPGAAAVPLKRGGVYVVTGGLGGAGRVLVGHLARGWSATVVVAGRSPLDAERRAALDGLAGGAGTVVYHQVDVADPAQAEALCVRTRREFGRIDGVVHAAGVTRDGLLLRKPDSAIDEVLAPKLLGAVNLDAATRGDALDVFALFGSFVVVAGNAGQSDYAYANSALDHFAAARDLSRRRGERSGVSVSFGWPEWEEGGMTPSAALRDRLARTIGLRPIGGEAAMAAFARGLADGHPQLVVAAGDAGRIRAAWRQREEEPAGAGSVPPPRPVAAAAAAAAMAAAMARDPARSEFARSGFVQPDPTGAARRAALAEALLTERLSAELDLPVERNEPLDRLGLDSVMIMNVTRTLERTFGPLPKTLFFEHQTVAQISAWLAEHCAGALDEAAAPPLPDPVPAEVAAPAVTSAGTGVGGAAATTDIAVIGISGRYPQAPDLDRFWANLRDGVDSIVEIPADRWNHAPLSTSGRHELGKSYARWGGFLDGIDRFDAEFFNIGAREAEVLDPQERLFMETAWHAVENAGYAPGSLAGRRIGVYVGVMYGQYQLMTGGRPGPDGSTPGSSYASIANRVSYLLDVRGPSLAVDTMCSSSLTALHLAVGALRRGETEMALVGGVNLSPHPHKFLLLSQGQFASSDGRCRSFGEGGDGYVPGEGVGAVLLKPLARAVADGDTVHAVIKACTINHGGRTTGYTVPTPRAQAEVIRAALDEAGWSPDTLDVVEAHGTGTALGDPIEIAGLRMAFAGAEAPPAGWSVGSLKSNIGHLESAAGIAGLTKLILQLRHRTLVPSLHAERLNPNVDWTDGRFRVQRSLVPWTHPQGPGGPRPRRAGLSSFGAGGSNAHVLVEEHVDPRPRRNAAGEGGGSELILLSARSPDRLRAAARALLDTVTDRPPGMLADVAHTLRVGRDSLPERLAIVADGFETLAERLRGWLDGAGPVPGVHAGRRGRDAVPATGPSPDELAAAWVAGGALPAADTAGLRRVPLPGTPFQRRRYWIGPALDADAAGPAGTAAAPAPAPATVTFEPVWRAEPAGDAATPDGGLLLIDGTGAFADVARVWPGGPEAVTRVEHPAALDPAGALPRRILFAVPDAPSPETAADLEGDLRHGFRAVLSLVQALLRQPSGGAIEFVYLYREATGAASRPAHAAMAAFLRTVQREEPRFRGKVVVLGADAGADAGAPVESLVREFGSGGWGGTVRLDGSRRRVAGYRPFAVAGGDSLPIRRGAVCLVTGGARGLGRIVAGMLARRLAARLVLTGRSEPDADAQAAFQRWREAGAEVVYVRGDMGDPADVARAVAEARARFGGLNAVIHSAGLTRDGLLLGKTAADIDAVFGPKLNGTLLLDAATRDDDLDAFVTFSSVAAVFGNAGQSDYAFANGFMDHAMEAREALRHGGRRRGLSLSIGWPLWREGGMRVDEALQTRALNRLGLDPLETADGLAALEDALRSGRSRVVVLRGDPGRCRALFEEGAAPDALPAAAPVPRGEAEAAALALLSDLMVRVARVEPDALDPDTPFGDYGFDSIVISHLTAELEDRLGPLSKTLFLQHPTLREVARHLGERHAAALLGSAGVEPDGPPAAVPAPAQAQARPAAVGGPIAASPIAIVGLDGRFPGAATPDELWDVLAEGRTVTGPVPPDRWTVPDDVYCATGGFLDGVDRFDTVFFGITALEAKWTSPEERLMLETVWRAFENGGIRPGRLRGRPVGVFMGMTTNTYPLLGGSDPSLDGAHFRLANRVSQIFDFAGPSVTLDTACSSSLVALHTACQSLRSGDCEVAVVGGVNLYLHPSKYRNLCRGRLLATQGGGGLYAEGGDGFVPGEAVGAVVLKPLEAARADGDIIHGVIVGSAAAHKGKGSGALLPSPAAHAALIGRALAQAGFQAADIGCVEVQAGGASLPDQAEWEAIRTVFAGSSGRHAVSSVKPNTGHAEAASGMVQLTKLLLEMRHGRFVPVMAAERIDPSIDLAASPFFLPGRLTPWTVRDGERRRAGINSFGSGGMEAHVIVEEADPADRRASGGDAGPELVVVSAKTEAALARRLSQLRSVAAAPPDGVALSDLAHTLRVGREAFSWRFACVVPDVPALLRVLDAALAGEEPAGRWVRGRARSVAGGHGADAQAVAAHWVAGGAVDWESPALRGTGRRIVLPAYPFEPRRCWITDGEGGAEGTAERNVESNVMTEAKPAAAAGTAAATTAATAESGGVVSGYYGRLVDTFTPGDGGADEFLTMVPLPRPEPGFSWLLTFAEPERNAAYKAMAQRRQEEMRAVLFDGVPFASVRRVLDIGCGLGSDLIRLARRHPHVAGDGFNITPEQVALCRRRVQANGVDGRVRIHHADSTRDPFPGTYDLVIAVEVLTHIRDKAAVFANVAGHLADGGQFVVADVVANTVAPVDLPGIGQFTSTQRQFAGLLAEQGLRLSRAVDVSAQIANFLDDPDFEANLARLHAAFPALREGEAIHRGWHNFGRALRLGLFRYLLLTAVRAPSGRAAGDLATDNLNAMEGSVPYEDVPVPAPAAPAASAGAATPPVDPEASPQAVLAALTGIACGLLEMRPDEIDPDARFADFGVDSLQGLRILDAVNRRFGLELGVRSLYDHSSLSDLARFIAVQHPEAVPGPAVAAEPPAAPAPAAPVTPVLAAPVPATPVPAVAAPTDGQRSSAIAVIGMAGRFPGADDVESFWENLRDGVDAVSEIPPDRWSLDGFYDPEPGQPDRSYCKWGGFLRGVDRFDPAFFRIAPVEAAVMDPQHRLFLESCWNALEDAGYAGKALDGQRCGVTVGALASGYQDILRSRAGQRFDARVMLGNAGSILASRIAYFLNLKGAALTIDTSCSSSLVALHLACRSLLDGDADLMLAGGITLYLTEAPYLMMSHAGMLSPTGRCRSFDADADGIVPGEAVGVLVLKRLDRALADGDHIHGVIRGTAVNQDGRTNGITAPSAESQAALMLELYHREGIDPDAISYVETHGTGTPLGDPVEIAGLGEAFRAFTARRGYCAIGSVKTNLGHSSAAAGVVGVIKTLLALKHRQIPPSLHFGTGNRHIDFAGSPFFVNTRLRPWDSPPDRPRLAAVSSFGFSGTNAHAVIEEFVDPRPAAGSTGPGAAPQVVLLSARSPEQLEAAAEQLADALERRRREGALPAIGDIAFTCATGRALFAERLAVLAGDTGALIDALRAAVRGEHRPETIFRGRAAPGMGRIPADSPPAEAARLWVSGAESAGWPWGIGRRVPLPTYPFARQRCWVGDAVAAPVPADRASPSSAAPALPAAEPVDHRTRDLDGFFHVPAWVPDPAAALAPSAGPSAGSSTGPGLTLVVCPANMPELVDIVRSWYPRDVLVAAFPGGRTGRRDARTYGLGAADAAAWSEVIGRIAADEGALPRRVCFLAGLVSGTPGLEPPALERATETGVASLFHLIKALIAKGALAGGGPALAELRIATNGVHRVLPDDRIAPHFAGLHGFAKCLAKEHPGLSVSCIDVGADGTWADRLAPLPAEPRIVLGEDIAFRAGRRYRRTLRAARLDVTETSGFVEGGVYLVVGGAGGIGLPFVRHLCTRYRARVAVVGRSEPDDARRRAFADMEAAGGHLLYIRADATDPAAMARAVARTRERFGRIDGAVHSALVVSREPVAAMDERSFRAVLDSKAAVAVALWEALRDDPPGLLMIFSSGQSFAGLEGRAHYAAGCTFKDAYAHALRQRAGVPVRIVNWGFWDVNDVAEDSRRRMARQGIAFMTPEDGVATIERIAAHRAEQVMCVQLDDAGMRTLGIDTGRRVVPLPETRPSCIAEAAAGGGGVAPEVVRRTQRQSDALEELTRLLVLDAFRTMGLFTRPGDSHELAGLGARLGVLPKFGRLLDGLLGMLRRCGFVTVAGGRATAAATVGEPATAEALARLHAPDDRLAERFPDYESQARLALICGRNLADILCGRVQAAEIMFPSSGPSLMQGVYRGNAVSDYFNSLTREVVASQVRALLPRLAPGEKIRILEVGAGTGSTSAHVLAGLKPWADRVVYTYTDLSKAFLLFGRKEFGADYPFVEYSLLDIEKPVAGQGLAVGGYDIVLAANVLHATRDIRRTLRQAKSLLSTRGWLVLYEMVRNQDVMLLTFGLLDGWWLYEDEQERLELSPLLGLAEWRRILHEEGFGVTRPFGTDIAADGQPYGMVMVAESDGFVTVPSATTATTAAVAPAAAVAAPVPAPSPVAVAPAFRPVSGPAPVAALAAADPDLRRRALACIRSVLQFQETDFNEDLPFLEMGVDSILSVDLVNALNDGLGIQLRATDLFNFATPRLLCDHIAGLPAGRPEPAAAPSPDHPAPAGPEAASLAPFPGESQAMPEAAADDQDLLLLLEDLGQGTAPDGRREPAIA